MTTNIKEDCENILNNLMSAELCIERLRNSKNLSDEQISTYLNTLDFHNAFAGQLKSGIKNKFGISEEAMLQCTVEAIKKLLEEEPVATVSEIPTQPDAETFYPGEDFS